MRISDWSSDVCSSDLGIEWNLVEPLPFRALQFRIDRRLHRQGKQRTFHGIAFDAPFPPDFPQRRIVAQEAAADQRQGSGHGLGLVAGARNLDMALRDVARAAGETGVSPRVYPTGPPLLTPSRSRFFP